MNFIGDKFESLGDRKFNRKEICTRLREDLKNEFKKPWKFTVAKDNYNGITITIKKAPKDAIKNINEKRHDLFPGFFNDEVYNKLMYIGNAYNFSDSEPMYDYYDNNYFLHFNMINLEIE